MDGLQPLGRILIVVGVVIAGLGLLFLAGGRIPFIGRLPGDLRIDWNGISIIAPLGTMIVVSIILTILLNLFLGRR